MDGWIKLHRKIKDHWIWKSERRLKWWIDILLTVNYSDSKVLIGGKLIECKRGQSVMSLETWAKRWNVTKKSVKDFFILLQNDSMLVYESVQITTRITVLNYDSYQIEVNGQYTDNTRTVHGDCTQTRKKRNKKNIGDYTETSFNFYLTEATRAKEYPDDSKAKAYLEVARHICQKDKEGNFELPFVLKIEKQVSLDNFIKLYDNTNGDVKGIILKIDSIQNKISYHNQYTDLYRTLNTWINNDSK